MLVLESSVQICTEQGPSGQLCLGNVGKHRSELAGLTVYTRNGTISAKHVEKRCSLCKTGYWHGYYTKVIIYASIMFSLF